MSSSSVLASLAAGLLISLSSMPGIAQQTATPEQLTLRPGDRIIWIDPSGGHVVLFGGEPLKPLVEIQKIFTFEPPLEIFENGKLGFSPVGGDPMLTATVKSDAARSGVTAIDFNCGAHPGDMRSRLFPIAPGNGQPPRQLKIKADGLDWKLETPDGDVLIDAVLIDRSRRLASSPAHANHRH
jgi:hypothetical protein